MEKNLNWWIRKLRELMSFQVRSSISQSCVNSLKSSVRSNWDIQTIKKPVICLRRVSANVYLMNGEPESPLLKRKWLLRWFRNSFYRSLTKCLRDILSHRFDCCESFGLELCIFSYRSHGQRCRVRLSAFVDWSLKSLFYRSLWRSLTRNSCTSRCLLS